MSMRKWYEIQLEELHRNYRVSLRYVPKTAHWDIPAAYILTIRPKETDGVVYHWCGSGPNPAVLISTAFNTLRFLR